MWQRLNYLVGLTKPAGYTSFANDEAGIPTSAFIIEATARSASGTSPAT